jgi:hypothetical protein
MCDYSLYEFPNRLAREREELVVYRFPSGTLGLAAACDSRNAGGRTETHDCRVSLWTAVKELFVIRRPEASPCAVCIPPGSRLIVRDLPARLQRTLALSNEEGAIFIEMSATPYSHRDGLLFQNGRQVRLQELCEGQRIEVLSLGGSAEMEEIPERHAILQD